MLAADMSSNQAEVVSKEINQRAARLNRRRLF
jgi:hypothetical protein